MKQIFLLLLLLFMSIGINGQELAVIENNDKSKIVLRCENGSLFLIQMKNNEVVWKENYGNCDYTVKEAIFWKESYITYTLKDGVTDRMIEFDKNSGKMIKEYILPEPKEPTKEQISYLCLTARYYEKDESKNSIGYTYHKALWEMSGAIPKVDPTLVGRAKVRKMWNQYKKIIRADITGTSRSEDLNVAKFAFDSYNDRFVSELVIAYKCDFNFVDKKDKMTLLDHVQERIQDQKRLTPPADNLIRSYENLYKAIVRNGGKHAKDLTKEELEQE